jgi:tetraacyldisaccharide 4'-kinase
LGKSLEQYGRRVMSGQERGVAAGALRAGLSVVSPVYAAVMRGRNLKFDRGVGVRRLPRPVVSVGNITTGGTGKTPVVRWLCERLRDAGERPAVLMRGYRAKPGERGDEEAMLDGLLNRDGAAPVRVVANPSRRPAGMALLAARPEVSVIVLDDGFQHRRVARDFDLVLIDATNPFGYGRVLPRGLLREPLAGLRRADAFLITRFDQADAGQLKSIEAVLDRYHPSAPRYQCSHVHRSLRGADGASYPLEALAGKRFFAAAGIGNPEGLDRQLRRLPGTYAGSRWFGDHFAFESQDVRAIEGAARAAGAEVVLTTEKDWVKLGPVLEQAGHEMPVWRLDLELAFEGEDERKLFEQVQSRLQSRGS